MIPDGLERDGEGWKLSVRICLIHGHMRQLFSQSGQWDTEAYGVPLHAAHIGLASALFSEQLMTHTPRLGVRMTKEERAERPALTNQGYRISRAFIGDEFADQLEFPKQRSFHILPALRLERQISKTIGRLLPGRAASRKAQALDSLLNAATPDDFAMGISYRLPVTIGNDPSRPW